MNIPATDWKNKKGTSLRDCSCGTWSKHWIKYAKKAWPSVCSVYKCNNVPTLGAHIINSSVTGERIVPMCSSCNGLDETFTLKGGITVTSASPAETCEAR